MQALRKPFVKAAMTYIAVTSTTDDWVLIIFYTQYVVAAPPEPNFNFHTHTHTLFIFFILFIAEPPLDNVGEKNLLTTQTCVCVFALMATRVIDYSR
jgi:hypothetical protein